MDVALAAGVRAVHLGRDDLDVQTARAILGADALIGGTANSLAEALRVAATDVDYLGVGPVFGTRSKANPAPPLGLEGFRAIVEAARKPVIAIGSVTADRVRSVLDAGAYGVAVLDGRLPSRSRRGRASVSQRDRHGGERGRHDTLPSGAGRR